MDLLELSSESRVVEYNEWTRGETVLASVVRGPRGAPEKRIASCANFEEPRLCTVSLLRITQRANAKNIFCGFNPSWNFVRSADRS